MIQPRTIFLARLAGLFLFLTSLAMLVQAGTISLSINALVHDRAALLVLVLFGLVGGLAMVLAHNVWSGGALPVIVTLIGWWLLLRNALLLFLPTNAVVALFDALYVEKLYYLFALTGLAIAIYLTYAGFRHRPHP